jgi:hypothetical protein
MKLLSRQVWDADRLRSKAQQDRAESKEPTALCLGFLLGFREALLRFFGAFGAVVVLV